jgi:glycopeptide antibiotics resistance protein
MHNYLRGINPELVQTLLFWDCWAIVFGLFLYTFLKHQRQFSGKLKLPKPAVFLLIVCYLVSVIAITLVPLPYSERYRVLEINYIPVVPTLQSLVDPAKKGNSLLAADVIFNIAGNILLFIPFGILVPQIFPKTNRYKLVAMAAFSASLFIELSQLASRYIGNYRQVDVDDVLLNTTGAMLGYFFYRQWLKRKNAIFKAEETLN